MENRVKNIFSKSEKKPDIIIIKNSSEPFIDDNFFYVTGLDKGIFEGSIAILYQSGNIDLIVSELEAETAKKSNANIKVYTNESELYGFMKDSISSSKNIGLKQNVKGFTLVDSVKTIETINSVDYASLYGWSTERALIFTGIRYGRSPMIAVRVHPVKPTVVVYHKPGAVDSLAIKLAERENIPLVVCNLPIDDLKKKLKSIANQ